MPTIQTNVVLAEESKIFFKEVEFDFSKICPKGIFMVENKTEEVKVVPYVVSKNTIVFNAWITKNIAYKVAEHAFKDKDGITTVTGPIRHITKVIQFGGAIELDLPEGVFLRKNDKAEVLSAKVIGSNDELLCPAEITEKYFMEEQGKQPQALRKASADCYKKPMGSCYLEDKYEDKSLSCSGHFEPKLFQYGKLREKMAIEIVVKAVRVSHLDVDAES